MGKAYIHIEKDYFDKTKEQANKKSLEDSPESDNYLWDNLNFSLDDINFDKGILNIGGETDLGYLNLDFDLGLDTVIDVIDFYMKKLGKLKTVLEATK